MTPISRSTRGRKTKRLSVVSAVAGPVAFMHPDDIGKLFVPGSKRTGTQLQPNYSTQMDGVDSVKVLMATDTIITFESFRPKGATRLTNTPTTIPSSTRSKAALVCGSVRKPLSSRRVIPTSIRWASCTNTKHLKTRSGSKQRSTPMAALSRPGTN
jgi:hypothetical protein